MSERIQVPQLRLGKLPYAPRDQVLMLAEYFNPLIRYPESYDFDKGKAPFPEGDFGNKKFANSVIVAQAHQIVRNERIEQKRTIEIVEKDVIGRYKALSGAKRASDEKDVGLYVQEAMHDWQKNGFHFSAVPNGPHGQRAHDYKIATFGELDPLNREQLRTALYILHGIHIGFWLPMAAQEMRHEGVWHYEQQSGSRWKPGSWGGFLAFSKKYVPNGFEILAWGENILVTNEFIEKYSDEAWGVIDNLESEGTQQTIDVKLLTDRLRHISAAE